jgi:hypothetical protein
MSDDRVGPGVGAVLEGLAVQNASGQLQAPGRVTARGVTTQARLRRAESGAGPSSAERQQPDEPDFTPVSLESLHQVLDGLRQLS